MTVFNSELFSLPFSPSGISAPAPLVYMIRPPRVVGIVLFLGGSSCLPPLRTSQLRSTWMARDVIIFRLRGSFWALRLFMGVPLEFSISFSRSPYCLDSPYWSRLCSIFRIFCLPF
eukprot:FR744130.1.p1 GENE.FR744130.1~~FR744130.1.p1  ORF type:complete len:116 (+),score=5.89 FR744130.1:646-993(+)